jgi:hypothetical protein
MLRPVPSPRLWGEGTGEGQSEAPMLERVAAPHPGPLPARLERGERPEFRGERETADRSHDATSLPSALKYMHCPASM